jgi:hypothetical protein
MSTLRGAPVAIGSFAEFSQSSVYISVFSGKLSPVMTHSQAPEQEEPEQKEQPVALPESREVGGREGPEPTRFGDWELRGRCIDF